MNSFPTSFEPVHISKFQKHLNSILPGVEMMRDTMGAVRLRWGIESRYEYGMATSEEHGMRAVSQLAEQMRIKAMRELGLDPIINAMKQEVLEYKQRAEAIEAALGRVSTEKASLEHRWNSVEALLDRVRDLTREDEDDE